MEQHILITGGTGLVGTRLTEILLQKGYKVSYLSRHAGEGKIKKYAWDIKNSKIDDEAILQADHIIHLAGAGVFEKRWTPEYRKEILDSRIMTTELLYKKINALPHKLKSFVSASAIGIYGFDTGDFLNTEESPKGKGFLADVTQLWEKAAVPIENTGLRTVKIRIGIVLSEKGGALTELAKPVKFFVGSPMGTGKQYIPWIDIDDLCGIFVKAIEDGQMHGVYNGVAPNPVTNEVLTKAIAKQIKRPLWLPNIPAFVMKLIVGSEEADLLLGGNKVSAEKIQQAGFQFKYPLVENSLAHLLK